MNRTLSPLHFLVGLAIANSACAASSPYMAKADVAGSVQADRATATVVFVRPSSYAPAVKVTILDGSGRFLGDSLPKTYFSAKLSPGDHSFVSSGEGTPSMEAHLEAGKIYYVEVAPIFGAWSARARLFAIGPQRSQWARLPSWLAGSTRLVPDEAAGQQHLADRPDDTRTVLEKGAEAFAGYGDGDRTKRTLLPTDGVTEAVASSR
jgi:hypothetical protein